MTKHESVRAVRPGEAVRTLVMGLWLPALFLTGLLFSYLPAFHHPSPHHIKVAVAASPATTARLQGQLDAAVPDGFTLQAVVSPAEARSAVLHHEAAAAYVPTRHHPQLYGAKADGTALESLVRQTFTTVAAATGTTVDFQELVPTVSGDVSGTSPLYVIMGCVIPAYFLVVTMQRAIRFNRRAHVATIVGFGAVAAVTGYLAAAYGMHAIPRHPLELLYLFLLTQAVSLTAYGLVPFFGNFFPGVAVTLFVMLGMPSSGGALPVELLPGFFRFLHPVLPMGNAIDAVRDVGYFDDRELGRPTAVLCAWVALGAMLVVLGYLKWLHRLAHETAQGITEYVPEPPAEDPTVELPEPVALVPHRHHFGAQDPILTGRVLGAGGEPVPGASITVTGPHGHQLLRTRTDANGEYAATGFADGAAIVVVGAPDRRPAAQNVVLSAADPVNLDFTLLPRQEVVRPYGR